MSFSISIKLCDRTDQLIKGFQIHSTKIFQVTSAATALSFKLSLINAAEGLGVFWAPNGSLWGQNPMKKFRVTVFETVLQAKEIKGFLVTFFVIFDTIYK